MPVDRYVLAHRGHIWRVYGVIALGIVTLVVAFVLLVFQPLSDYLRHQYRRELTHFLDTRLLLIRHTEELHAGLARQVASRTVIRRALADYDAGRSDLEHTRAVTAPKLGDAVKYGDAILGIERFARDGRQVARVGRKLPEDYGHPGCDGADRVSMAGPAPIAAGSHALIYYSPIVQGGRLLGCDALMMSDVDMRALVAQPFATFGNLFLLRGREIIYAPVQPVSRGFQDALQASLAGSVPADYLVETRPAPIPGWQLAVVVDRHELFRHLDQVLDRMVVLVVSITVLIFMSLVVALRPILRTLVAERELYELSHVDGLTGLYNHRHFQEMMDRELSRLGRQQQHALSLLILDLDHFKRVNDRYGHQTGDAVLRACADTLRACLRGSDIPARYGGEEFAVVLPDTGPEQARALAERLREAVGAAVVAAGDVSIQVTVSIGIAGCRPGEQPDSKVALIEAADQALYEAKRSGRNRVILQTCGVRGPPN